LGDLLTLSKPSEVRPVPQRDAGGDNEVPRDGLGRPRILLDCPICDKTGKVPSEKVAGRMNKCPKCKGETRIMNSYTRTTTYIDCIEDKSNLQMWHKRMVLIGAALDPTLTDGVLDRFEALSDEEKAKEAKDWLNRRAESAAEKAGASEKADKGTFLHGLSELVDEGKELPDDVDFGDVIDMDSYRRATTDFNIVHMEKLVVLDEFKVAGTPDRISTWHGSEPLVAPDGHVFAEDELIITDLKTGTVDYGALKMAMQLAIYAHSKLYDPETGKREDLGKINLEWGIIMNCPAGSGETTLYWADLTMGWAAVRIAREIRQLRSTGKKALSMFKSVSL
jgi:hypothetical protein